MIGAVGVDVHCVADTDHALAHFGLEYVRRLFNDEELEFVASHPATASRFLAERFAAREAVVKLLGLPDLFVHWSDISVVLDTSSSSSVILRGKSSERAAELGFPKIHLTTSSTRQIAIAVAIADVIVTQD